MKRRYDGRKCEYRMDEDEKRRRKWVSEQRREEPSEGKRKREGEKEEREVLGTGRVGVVRDQENEETESSERG
jgi:hypothetical protein